MLCCKICLYIHHHIFLFIYLFSIEEAILHGIDIRTKYHMKDIRHGQPLSLSDPHYTHPVTYRYRPNTSVDEIDFDRKKNADIDIGSGSDDEKKRLLYLPLAVVESGASYCNRVDQYGRPIVYLKLGKLEAHRHQVALKMNPEHGNNKSSSSSSSVNVYTHDDYLYSMLYTLER